MGRTATRFVELAVLIALGSALTACGDGEKDDAGRPGAGSQVRKSGMRVELNCFSFTFRNTFDSPVVDVHIPIDGEVVVATAPPGWGHTGGAGEIKFETPPPSGGSTSERPRPVAPGGLSGRYVFYLPSDGPTEGGAIELSFEQGPNRRVDDIWQGGEPVPVGTDGLKHIKKNGTAYCQEIEVKAPDGTEVKDIHLDRLPGGNPTDFLGLDLPTGWVSNPLDPGSITIFTEGGGPGIPPGGTLRFKVYYGSVNARATWRLTDGSFKTIDGAEGVLDFL